MKIGRNKGTLLYWTDYIYGKRVKRESRKWRTQREAIIQHASFIKIFKDKEVFIHNRICNQLVEL